MPDEKKPVSNSQHPSPGKNGGKIKMVAFGVEMLEKEVIPTQYDKPEKWQEIVFKGMDDVLPKFTSKRQADEYYKKLFNQKARG